VILADTSIWIEHFRSRSQDLQPYLERGQIVMHPFVLTELALGSLKDRDNTLALLDQLPQLRMSELSEVRHLVENRRLYARGLGLVDACLIASVLITPGTLLWTQDKPLRKVGEALGIHITVP
jgi:predicted nucleic acid-binding protein